MRGLIASLFVGMVLLLALNLPLAPVWAELLPIPRPYLYVGILFFAAVGAYAVGGEAFDLVGLLAWPSVRKAAGRARRTDRTTV